MLTLIGIVGLSVLALVGLGYIIATKCLVVTEAATYTVVGLWGKSPTEIFTPPWNLIFYPLTQIMGVITTEVQRYNMPNCTVTCKMTDPSGGQGIGKLSTKEVSLAYQFYFWTPAEIRARSATVIMPPGFGMALQLQKFFEFVGFHEAKIDIASMEEALKDSLQGAFSQYAKELELVEAINFPSAKLDEIARALQEEFWTTGLPVRVISLQRNAPFDALDALGKAIADRAKSLAELPSKVAEAENARRLAVINANAAKEVAGIAVETARLAGEADGAKVKVRVAAILEAYGLTALPPAERMAHLLSLQSLEVYKEMAASPSSKLLLVPTDMLKGIGGALNRLTGGTP